MTVWRDTCTRSPNGTIMGMVSTAWPEPEAIKKLSTVWMINIACEAKMGCSCPTLCVMACRKVSKICPLLAMMTMACAKHKSMAISAMLRTPSKKAVVNLFMDILPKKPHKKPTPKNRAAISVMYQPEASRCSISIKSTPHMPLIMAQSCGLSTPMISPTMPSPKAKSTHFWRRVMRVSSLLSFNSLRFFRSNS